MSWGLVIGGVTAVGGALLQRGEARSAGERADVREERILDFEQKRLDDWNEVYGPIQNNLSEYYQNLTPDYFETAGLEAIEQERALSQKRIEEVYSQRGVADSGIRKQADVELEIETAGRRADVRRTAPALAREEQTRFLQVGLGSDPSQSYSSILAEQAGESRREASEARRAASEAVGSAIETIGTGLVDYLGT